MEVSVTMKVAILVKRFPVLSESFVLRLVESLYESGTEVSVCVTEDFDSRLLATLSPRVSSLVDEGQIPVNAPRLLPGRSSPWKAARFLLSLATSPVFAFKLFRQGIRAKTVMQCLWARESIGSSEYGIVHAQFLPVAVAAVAATSSTNCIAAPHVVSYIRGFDVSTSDAVTDREFSTLLAAGPRLSITSVSRSLVKRIVDRGFPGGRVEVVHAGLPLQDLKYRPPSSRNNARLKLVQVGRLVEKKGYELSLRALANLDHQFDFHIIGDGDDAAKLHMLANELGIATKVFFHGAMNHSDTVEFVGNCDVMLTPSVTARNGDVEGIPNVIKEAMALGVICLGSNHSGIPELLSPGVTGFLFNEGQIDDYVEQLNYLISSRHRWDDMSNSARDLIESSFEASNVTKRLLHHYQTMSAVH